MRRSQTLDSCAGSPEANSGTDRVVLHDPLRHFFVDQFVVSRISLILIVVFGDLESYDFVASGTFHMHVDEVDRRPSRKGIHSFTKDMRALLCTMPGVGSQ